MLCLSPGDRRSGDLMRYLQCPRGTPWLHACPERVFYTGKIRHDPRALDSLLRHVRLAGRAAKNRRRGIL